MRRTLLQMAGLWLATNVMVAVQAADVPDLSGVWIGSSGGGGAGSLPRNPPLTAAGKSMEENFVHEDDPSMWCAIDYGRAVSSSVIPFEIVQQEKRITLLYEYGHQVRRIFLDGRSHPTDIPPSFMGHSIGHWDKDTLVVETRLLYPGFFRDGFLPYSEKATVTERYSISPDRKTLTVMSTIEDPEYYDKPWNWTTTYIPTDRIMDFDCLFPPFLDEGVPRI